MNEAHPDHETLRAVEAYERALNRLAKKIGESEILEALAARETLASALQTHHHLRNLGNVLALDDRLRAHVTAITDTISADRLRDWRETVGAVPAAWWWRLDEVAAAQDSPLWVIVGGAASRCQSVSSA